MYHPGTDAAVVSQIPRIQACFLPCWEKFYNRNKERRVLCPTF